MKKSLIALAVGAALSGAGANAASTEDRLKALEKRLNYLEQRVRAQDEVIQEKDRQIADLTRVSSGGGAWFQSVEIGGVVEIEAGHTEQDGASDTSDITVPIVEIGIAAQVNDWVAAELVALYEDDGDSNGDLNIDVAVITIADPDANWYFLGGQYTVPFGVYETHMISDPLTLELGETSDAGIQFGMANDTVGAAVFVFEGDQGNREIDNFGATVGFETETKGIGFAASAGYLNDIAEADAIVDDGTAMTDEAGAWVVSAMISVGNFSLIGEYLTATDEIAAYANDEPSAFNIEAAYTFHAGSTPAGVAIGYQGTDDAANTAGGMPESRILAAVGFEIMDRTSLAFEYAMETDYAGAESNTLTGQLAVEF